MQSAARKNSRDPELMDRARTVPQTKWRNCQAWISRFEIWPYLENFGHDVEREALAQLSGRPRSDNR